MKANEAPEKIYVVDATFPDCVDFDGSPINTKRIDGHDIEYTRTDAFMEKVSGWLKDCATFTDMNGKKRVDEEMYKATIEDFEKYLKGE